MRSIYSTVHTHGLKHVPPDLRSETEKFGPIHVVHGRTHGIGPGDEACVANSFQDFSAGLAKSSATVEKSADAVGKPQKPEI